MERNHSERYQEINKNNPPRDLAIRLSPYLCAGMTVLDIGCGAGIDSIYFIEQGCSVIAMDKETNIIEKRRLELEESLRSKLSIIKADFTGADLPLANAIYASLSLPFCHPNKFIEFHCKLGDSLSNGGIFAGTFFGINDDWYNTDGNIIFHRKEEIEELFKGYTIQEFIENEYEGTYVNTQGSIAHKHWHIYEIIAIKN